MVFRKDRDEESMKNSDLKLISIAMCTYNGAKFIEEQLSSILNQTYKNIEIIITDDGSSDKTIEIIKKYQQNDKRIRLYQNEKNLGFVKNFEKAISLCLGEYIALADQDDIWKLNKLEMFSMEIKDNLLIYSDTDLIDKNSVTINKQLIRPRSNLVSGRCNKAFVFYNCASGNTMMFKKELLNKILPIPEKISYHDIWIVFIASSIGNITYTEESYTYYRRYSEQVTATIKNNYTSFKDKLQKKKQKKIQSIENRLKDIQEFRKIEYLDDEMKIFLNLIEEHFINYNNGYFNIKLYRYLLKHKNEIFEIKKEQKRVRYARNISSKLKLHQISFFSI